MCASLLIFLLFRFIFCVYILHVFYQVINRLHELIKNHSEEFISILTSNSIKCGKICLSSLNR